MESGQLTARYSVALMNNTKWREVLAEISSAQVWFSIAYVGEEKYGTLQALENLGLFERHVGDGCLIGGPVEYKDIFAIRIERFEEFRNTSTGKKFADESKSLELTARLKNVGLLPIEVDEQHITIFGYKP
ncbi:DUF6678 family protein [Thiosocius teredinicola]|uniref:DUF6678 family protein n=1 Tax=Thiosocius teredinicola TaxID=1973002 RepID=UPI000F7B808C